jgi:hypothetical protein
MSRRTRPLMPSEGVTTRSAICPGLCGLLVWPGDKVRALHSLPIKYAPDGTFMDPRPGTGATWNFRSTSSSRTLKVA